MFDSPPPPDNFPEKHSIPYTPTVEKDDIYNPFGVNKDTIPDALATSVDQVINNHLLEQSSTVFKDYKESFSGESLFDWTDKGILQEYFDNFDPQRPVRLFQDSSGNYSMNLTLEKEKGDLKAYLFRNIPASLVENYLNKDAKLLSAKYQLHSGYTAFDQKFPAYTINVKGESGIFAKDLGLGLFKFAHDIEVVEKR